MTKPTEQFQHNGATYTVHELTIMQQALLVKLTRDVLEAWVKDHESDFDSYPRRLDVLIPAYLQYMFTTDIEGTVGFQTVNPALANGNLAQAYDSWETVILSDRDLQTLWDTAVKTANKELTDPEASSDVPSGDSK